MIKKTFINHDGFIRNRNLMNNSNCNYLSFFFGL